MAASKPSVNCWSQLPSAESTDDLPCFIADRIGTSVEKRNDVLTYLKEVKDTFKDQRDKYDLFMNAMKDFMTERIDVNDVIAVVKKLFEGHDNLICGLRKLLPKGDEITVLDVEELPPKRDVHFEDAVRFVIKIKKRFENDVHIYKSFIANMDMFRKKQKDTIEVYHELAILFNDHPDLIEEFTRYLPDSAAVALANEDALIHDFDRSAKF